MFMILIGKMRINYYDCWIVSIFGIKYGFRIVKVFRIFTGQRMMNDYCLVCVFGIVSCFGM